MFEEAGLDAETMTPGRQVVHHIGESPVRAMEMAMQAGDASAAQVVAAECVVGAETKDHLNEEEEDEHLYHTQGWARELWIEGLGMPAVLPPPEEPKDVKTAIAAARAKKARRSMKKAG